jgi:hypothetical protein
MATDAALSLAPGLPGTASWCAISTSGRSPRPTSTQKFSPRPSNVANRSRVNGTSRAVSHAATAASRSGLLRPSSSRVSAIGVAGPCSASSSGATGVGGRTSPPRQRCSPLLRQARAKKPTSRHGTAQSTRNRRRALSLSRGASVSSGSPRSSATRAAVRAR